MPKSKLIRLNICILLVLVLGTNSCTKNEFIEEPQETNKTIEYLPNACFSFITNDNNKPKAGIPISFESCSKNANAYKWVFSDGFTSNEENPTHTFSNKGIYTVKLTVFKSNSTDSVSMEIPIDCEFDNYLIHKNIPYKIEKAKLSSSTYQGSKRFCIQLWNNNISFDFDSIYGNGNAIQINCSGAPESNTFRTASGSNALPAFSGNVIADQKINLEEQYAHIEINNDSILILLQTENTEIYYHGTFSKGYLFNHPTLGEVEKMVRRSQDPRAQFTYEQYETLLAELSKEKYLSLTIYDMINTHDPSKVIVGMRHDIDCHPFKALEMAKMENTYGIKASYYVLATSNYYGEFYPDSIRRNRVLDKLYQQLYQGGAEIGIHNDLLVVMITKKLDPLTFNWDEIHYYESLGIPIYGNVGHGSSLASQTVHNSQMFSDFADNSTVTYNGQTYPLGSYSMYEYGFSYEANFFDFNQYYSESGGRWSIEGGFEEVLSRLKNSKPGDRIQILTHPVWWGK